MPELFVNCPTTHRSLPTGVKTDVESLRASWKAVIHVNCPYCQEPHKIAVREAYVDVALSAALDGWLPSPAPPSL
jgi:hypothetical protein